MVSNDRLFYLAVSILKSQKSHLRWTVEQILTGVFEKDPAFTNELNEHRMTFAILTTPRTDLDGKSILTIFRQANAEDLEKLNREKGNPTASLYYVLRIEGDLEEIPDDTEAVHISSLKFLTHEALDLLVTKCPRLRLVRIPHSLRAQKRLPLSVLKTHNIEIEEGLARTHGERYTA